VSFARPALAKKNVEPPLFLFDDRKEPIKVARICNVSLNRCDVAADLFRGRVELSFRRPVMNT
jgi:hypothetical protein